MAFSTEWEKIYSSSHHLSRWPWSSLVSLVHRHCAIHEGMKVLELGCGAGANIPFFVSLKSDYHAVDGSGTVVAALNDEYKGNAMVDVKQGDFTSHISVFGGDFELIFDRGALTHNSTAGIESVLKQVYEALKPGGIYIGVDWFSTSHSSLKRDRSEKIDDNTYVFSEGYFKDLGQVHFADEKHLKDLFAKYDFLYLAEKENNIKIPGPWRYNLWDFVVRKPAV
ncbi:MAG: class I SAM-dependent methyltransferase [Succinivibrionaceae bacterium]|nr:class I SAM-dependent methyltransferase [Succinivibrionaceae bacterium]